MAGMGSPRALPQQGLRENAQAISVGTQPQLVR